MNTITKDLTHTNPQEATNVSPLDTQATAQTDISLVTLPVSMLVVSEHNVRKSKAKESDNLSLQASILAHGLIQNLVVLPVDDSGCYPVISGGRRLAALQALIGLGSLPADYMVAVKVLSEEEASIYGTEISLTENLTRAAMHPADEFTAFSEMIEQGATVEAVAQRFGKTQLYVHQRMKLAAVNAEILEAYREDNITLERVMIFTIASPERQAYVWAQLQERSHLQDHQIRYLLKEEAIEEGHLLVRFVGREEYENAGGVVTSDLFSEKVYFEDRRLLESLATQKLEQEAEKLKAQGWMWTQTLLQRTHDESRGYLELTSNQGKYKKAEKALAGCIIALNYNAEVKVIKGLVAKAERKALKALQNPEKETAQGGLSDSVTVSSDSEDESTYSNALMEDLKAHRLVMAKHALMENSALAVDVLHFAMCSQTFVQYGSTPLDLKINDTHTEPKQGDFNENKALARIEAVKESLDTSWLEADDLKARFMAFQMLDADEKQKQVAYATALMLRASLAEDSSRFGYEFLFSMLDFDAADYWRPTTDSFLKRINKESLIEIARPVMSEEWQKTAQALKKGDLAKQLDSWVGGSDKSLTEVQRAHFDKWMPTGF